MSSDAELHNLMGTSSSPVRRKIKKKKIPMVGHFNKRRRLLRNSNNLRFKDVYKPISPIVAFCFFAVAFSIWAFLHYFVHKV